MRKNTKRILAACALLAPFAIAGCATHLELDQAKKELRAELEQVKAAAAAASARADASSAGVASTSRSADRMHK